MRAQRNFLLLLVLLISCGKHPAADSNSQSVTVLAGSNRYTFQVEVADDSSEREVGLMNRTSMSDSAGMLFIWNENVLSSFWMKNTYVSLDILFIGENRRILYIASNTTPLSTDLITPPESFRYVLEVKAGFTDSSHVQVGDLVEINL